MQLTLSTHRNKQMCYQQNIPVLLLILKHPLLALSVVQKGGCLKFQSSHQLPFWRLPRLYECHTFSFPWRKHDNIQHIHNWIFSGHWDEICGNENFQIPIGTLSDQASSQPVCVLCWKIVWWHLIKDPVAERNQGDLTLYLPRGTSDLLACGQST